MRIVYIAKHDSGGGDDEGAITYALSQLGHDVQRVRELNGSRAHRVGGDFALFHKWADFSGMRRLKMPKVFWYFDLVYQDDPAMKGRNRTRMEWMREVMPLVDLGFCTDGDWVKADTTGKLRWLPQGADERVARQEFPRGRCQMCNGPWGGLPILFTGTHKGGQGRQSFIQEMTERYHHFFQHTPGGVYREHLGGLIANTHIVVAPDCPVSDRYWSNRVYTSLGFEAFLLHPYCGRLAEQYEDLGDLVFYRSREELHAKIEVYLNEPEERRRISKQGRETTLARHTYRHRCEELIRQVKELLP